MKLDNRPVTCTRREEGDKRLEESGPTSGGQHYGSITMWSTLCGSEFVLQFLRTELAVGFHTSFLSGVAGWYIALTSLFLESFTFYHLGWLDTYRIIELATSLGRSLVGDHLNITLMYTNTSGSLGIPRPRYNLVVDEDDKKPTKQTNQYVCDQFLNECNSCLWLITLMIKGTSCFDTDTMCHVSVHSLIH